MDTNNDGKLEICDQNNDAEISIEEALLVSRLSISSNLINELYDLSHFPNLKRVSSVVSKGFKNVNLTQCQLLEDINISFDENVQIENFIHLKKCIIAITNNVNRIIITENDSLLYTKVGTTSFFANIDNLEYVNMSRNNLESIDLEFMWKKKNYKEFDCSYNKLNKINIYTIMSDFDVINFSNNLLTNSSLPMDGFPFKTFPTGEITDLSNNLFTFIALNHQSISSINYSGNPLKGLTVFGKLATNSTVKHFDFTPYDMESIILSLEGEIDFIKLGTPSKLDKLTLTNLKVKEDIVIDNSILPQNIGIDIQANIKFTNINEKFPENTSIKAKNIYIDYSSKTVSKLPWLTVFDTLSIQSSPQLQQLNNEIFVSAIYKNLMIRNNSLLESINLMNNYDLQVLTIENCPSLLSIDVSETYDFYFYTKNLPNLKTLKLSGIKGSLNDLPNLKDVTLHARINSFANLYDLNSLEKLIIIGSTIGTLSLDNLPKLKELIMGSFNPHYSPSCYTLKRKPDIVVKDLPNLNIIKIGDYCLNSIYIGNLPNLDSLTLFELENNEYHDQIQLINLPNLVSFETKYISTNHLILEGLNKLKVLTLNGIIVKNKLILEKLNSLEKIELNGVSLFNGLKVNSLPALKSLKSPHIYLEDILMFQELPSLENLALNMNGGQIRNVKSTFTGLPLLKNLELIADIVTIDTLNFNQCPRLDSIHLKLWGKIKLLCLKNNNENLVYFNKETYFGKFGDICVDSEKEKDFILPQLHSQTQAKFIFDCEIPIISSEISGKILLQNEDGTTSLLNNEYIVISIKDDSEKTITTDGFGNFNYFTTTLNKDIIIEAMPDLNQFEIVQNSITLNFSTHGIYDNNNLILKRKPLNLNNLAVYLTPVNTAVPGFEANYQLMITNFSKKSSDVFVEIYFDDSVMEYIPEASDFSLQQSGLVVSSNIHLLSNDFLVKTLTFKLNKPTDPIPLKGNDILNLSAKLITSLADISPEDNESKLSQIVRNSFDPNNIVCLQGEKVADNSLIDQIYYQINFENKGNGDANNVSIVNQIDTNFLDINSLKIINASHTVFANYKSHEVEFLFDNIQLSYQQNKNQGFVFYKIKPKKLLSQEDSIYNKANIYFDFNAPIATNIHFLSLSKTTASQNIDKSKFMVYPNPVTGVLNIAGDFEPEDKISIFGMYGNEINFEQHQSSLYFDAEVPNGMYLLIISNGKKIKSIVKFVLVR